MARFSRLFRLLLAAGLALPPMAFAAHPLQTEDTGTQGLGNIEIENGMTWSRDTSGRRFIYQPQVSYGVSPVLDLIVQPSFLHHRDIGDDWHSDFGDTNLDAKWRFYGSSPWSLGLRAGLQIATASGDQGLSHGTVGSHEILVLTYDEAPLTIYGNLGGIQNPASSGLRREVVGASTAALWTVNGHLILTGELATGADPTLHRGDWPSTALAGFIWTIIPGLDSDIGYVRGFQQPASQRWLAGLTYRFAY